MQNDHIVLGYIVMKCSVCGYNESKVIDSRSVDNGIRRRRQCLKCDARFTTYERMQPRNIFVVKKDSRREEFNREKLLAGVRKACEKRPLDSGAVAELVDNIEAELYQTGKAEVLSSDIGDMVTGTGDHIKYAWRQFRFFEEFGDQQPAGYRCFLRGFQYNGVADGQCNRQATCRKQQREVPR